MIGSEGKKAVSVLTFIKDMADNNFPGNDNRHQKNVGAALLRDCLNSRRIRGGMTLCFCTKSGIGNIEAKIIFGQV